MDDLADAEAHRLVHRLHPRSIALGQVVVHRDDVHRDTGQGHGARRQRGGQRLPLSRRHLGHHPLQQDPAAHQLHVVVALAQSPAGKLADQREGPTHRLYREAMCPQLGSQGLHLPGQLLVAHPFQLLSVAVCGAHDVREAG